MPEALGCAQRLQPLIERKHRAGCCINTDAKDALGLDARALDQILDGHDQNIIVIASILQRPVKTEPFPGWKRTLQHAVRIVLLGGSNNLARAYLKQNRPS